MKKKSPQLKVKPMDEKEWALECAVRILKRKHDADTRHVQKILNQEAMLADIKIKLNHKEQLLKKMTD